MVDAWHRSEPRDVRPFYRSTSAEGAVARSFIRLFENSDPVDITSFDLDEFDLARLNPSVLPILAPVDTWLPDGFSPDAFELLIIATNGFLHQSIIVVRTLVCNTVPSEIAIPAETLEVLGGGRNLALTIAVCLRDDHDPLPGHPFIIGHWLSRKDFKIRSKSFPALFDVRSTSEDEWEALGLPGKTLYTVEYLGGISEPADDTLHVATVRVHADAYTAMLNDSIGSVLQPILAAEIISQVLEDSASDWRELDAATVDTRSALATVLKQLSMELPALKSLVSNGGKSKLRAMLQANLGAVRAIY